MAFSIPSSYTKRAAKTKTSAPKVAAPTVQAPVAQAAKRYTGAYSGALNSISEAQQRVHDVAARRQADNAAYTAYTMGKQGAIAAAAQQQDQNALRNTIGVQAATLGAQQKLQAALGTTRAAQGIEGPVPAQQMASVTGDAARTQALIGAVGQQQASQANTNVGKAGFLGAAAQAAMLANSRAIAGDEYNQFSDLEGQKRGILVQKTESAKADKRAAAQAAADQYAAELAASERAADRASREGIAGATLAARANESAADRATRLQLAKMKSTGQTPAAHAKQKASNIKFRAQIETAAADAKTILAGTIPVRDAAGKIVEKDGKPQTRRPTKAEALATIRNKYKDRDIAAAAIDFYSRGHLNAPTVARLRARGIAIPKAWLPKSAGRGSSLAGLVTDPNAPKLSLRRP